MAGVLSHTAIVRCGYIGSGGEPTLRWLITPSPTHFPSYTRTHASSSSTTPMSMTIGGRSVERVLDVDVAVAARPVILLCVCVFDYYVAIVDGPAIRGPATR